ncbi:hypothetical protein E2C01_066870 [Portunus trituberculatus]|uniref:Uncharacterized protein n=1 Tax=Portunus trituberculatus TaxID=210409 RepID=A0A5B7HTH5_PORTR|nr:hypothetical protein [Portunus trituberculatus]
MSSLISRTGSCPRSSRLGLMLSSSCSVWRMRAPSTPSITTMRRWHTTATLPRCRSSWWERKVSTHYFWSTLLETLLDYVLPRLFTLALVFRVLIHCNLSFFFYVTSSPCSPPISLLSYSNTLGEYRVGSRVASSYSHPITSSSS